MTEHPSFSFYLEAWLYCRLHGLTETHRIVKMHFSEWRLEATVAA